MKKRYWSIRSKIIVLVAVPLTALLALWVFATALTAGPAFNLLSARTVLDNVGNPGIELVGQLQRERLFSVEYLSATGPVPQSLLDQRSATDKAIATFRRLAEGDDARGATNAELRGRIDGFVVQLDSLTGNRVHIDKRSMDEIGAQNLYNSVIASGFQTFAATATFNDQQIDGELRALTTVGQGQEYLSRVDALVGGATAAGRFTPEVRGELIQDVGTARFLLARGVEAMAESDRVAYNQVEGGVAFDRLDSLLNQLVQQSRDGAATPVSSAEFRPSYVAVAQELRAFEISATDALTDRARPVAERVLLRLGLAGILGLGALAFSLYLSVRVGRSIVGRLRRLHGEAREMAAERLPAVVRRLQRGEDVDVDVETPPLEYGRDEIGQLGQAFNEVQRTALQSAVEEATVRRGLNEVFLNIARRSQTLLHRQLALLDRMERRETEPQELEDLYRVDHLATRMRRHAEDLVILAGAAPGRGWRNPVPVIDVVRGAISEVEDYKRIDIRSVESASVLGRAVGDVIHLLAELLENAASFSPPHTRVQVTGQVLPNGYGIEIEDRGLGMSPEAIDEANRRLVEPPEFDPADSARLGLFVVAQLAGRHGIRVSLRPSAFAGVTAIVLVPGDLVVGAGPIAALPDGGSTGERPLVGSGRGDPSRSLAALQWQGGEQLQQVTASGHPIIDGTARPGPEAPQPVRGVVTGGLPRSPAAPGGPAPSSVADGLSEDGLVQRRRVRRPAVPAPDPDATVPVADLGPVRAELQALNAATEAPPRPEYEAGNMGAGTPPSPRIPAPRAVPRNSAPSAPAMPAVPTRIPAAPTGAQTEVPRVSAPLSVAPATDNPEEKPAGGGGTTSEGLPRRVRQASLVPQLRRPAGALPPEPEPQLRSPEQVRSIMNALQLGTTRGRIDASRYLEQGEGFTPRDDPAATGEGSRRGERRTSAKFASEDRANADDTDIDRQATSRSFADAATVSFPAIVNLALARDSQEHSNEHGDRAHGDAADGGPSSGGDDVTRPEKDA
ncbi:sensor histidine kinase [Paractinoplanes brasiliensis]|uniref:histidine kinase n=1 Tax=Paractinoplanes brasiliensis TaxID=52695 RepID=A0A4R6JP61_9ACTN|nr:nitrate- and nitrite sensing domain-containing protein [Actinoplanes brasiliensis]TDO38293.1 signal transduction histidine kinase [Actinoplanes brasiliensis]